MIPALIDRVQKTPNARERKVFVFLKAHPLNQNAANGLFTTLEELPADLTLFLTTRSKIFLLPIIIRRCALHHLLDNPITISPPKFPEWLDKLELC
jgi:DNA polymerase III gamma/tau subunit